MFEEQLAAVPRHPPRTGVLPGMRLGAALPRSAILMLLVLVLFFGSFPLLIISSDPQAKLGFGPSRTVEGRILGATEVSSCRGSAAHHIVYAFSAEPGGEFRGTSDVCAQSPYYAAKTDDRIEIRYLARDPAVNAIAGTESNDAPPLIMFMVFPLFFLFVISPMYFPQLRGVMRARRLYRTAPLVQGTVVFVKRRSLTAWPGWPGSSTADVYVSHQLASGERAETIAWCANEWLVNHLAPGATVNILVPPEKSGRGALLEAFIR